MSTTAIFVVAFLVGLLMAGIVLLAVAIAWLLWQLRKLVTGLKADVPLLLAELGAKLAKQTELLDGKLANIHGDKLAKASIDCIAAARRIEQASLAFAELTKHLLAGEDLDLERAERGGLKPEDYAPNSAGDHFVSQSKVSAADAVIEAEQTEELHERQW